MYLPWSSCQLSGLCSRWFRSCHRLWVASIPTPRWNPIYPPPSSSEENQECLAEKSDHSMIIKIPQSRIINSSFTATYESLNLMKTVAKGRWGTYRVLRWWNVHKNVPTIWMVTVALSSTFSICTWSSYFPESLRSVLLMKRMLSVSLFLTLTCFVSRGSLFFIQVAFGLGFPWRKVPFLSIMLKKATILFTVTDYYASANCREIFL